MIGFNEAPDGHWTKRVGKVLGMGHSYVGKISSANHKDKYKTILSRFPLEETGEISLKGVGWNPASAVKAVIRKGGIPITLYSLHICGSKKDKGHAHFFHLDVTTEALRRGFVLRLTSEAHSKLKLLRFSGDGTGCWPCAVQPEWMCVCCATHPQL